MSSIKRINSKFWGSILVFIIPMVLGIIYYNQLPSTMAVHFNSQNVADGFAPKWFALFGIPLFLMLIHGFTLFIVQNDPKKEGHSKVVENIIYWMIPILAIIVQIICITYGLGKKVDISTYMLVGVGMITMILGNYLPKSRQNYSVGIRLPWTLASEEIWNKTHRMAGKLWIVSGMLITLLAILDYVNTVIFIIFIMSIMPCIYAYTLYKNIKSQK